MKYNILFVVVLLAVSTSAQYRPKCIGEIEFFGCAGIDLNKLRSSLPFREGDEFGLETAEGKLKQAFEAVKQATGKLPTDIAPVCCDRKNNWMIYIGLAGKTISYNPVPKGTARLPFRINQLYENFMNAMMIAVQKGAAIEDRSKGYALSEDPALRAAQLEMRAYAIGHEALICKVLTGSADGQQRIVAAELLGYSRRSKSQLTALEQASHDRNNTVRNNAIRALMVLVESDANLAKEIPAGKFAELLLSGTWTDLNKASLLLAAITKNRDPEVLLQLRNQDVLQRLVEMAHWRSGHAEAAQFVLGRIAGIDEERLIQLVADRNVQNIIDRLQLK